MVDLDLERQKVKKYEFIFKAFTNLFSTLLKNKSNFSMNLENRCYKSEKTE